MQIDNNTIALGVVMLIVVVAVGMNIEGAKDIANVAIGGLVGFLSGKSAQVK